VLPRVSHVMSDLEPPTNWSQLVSIHCRLFAGRNFDS
jgi:hypothetical protein